MFSGLRKPGEKSSGRGALYVMIESDLPSVLIVGRSTPDSLRVVARFIVFGPGFADGVVNGCCGLFVRGVRVAPTTAATAAPATARRLVAILGFWL